MVRRESLQQTDRPSNPTSPRVSRSSWQTHHNHPPSSNPSEYFRNILESSSNHHQERKYSFGSPKLSPVPRSQDQSDYWKLLFESGTAIHSDKKRSSGQSLLSTNSLSITPESCASYPNLADFEELLLDGRRSAPPNFQELLDSKTQYSTTNLTDHNLINGLSSSSISISCSSSSSTTSEPSSSSSPPELQCPELKKSYRDAALSVTNFKQHPNTQLSSSVQVQPSQYRSKEIVESESSQKRPTIKPASGSSKFLFKFGNIDESLVENCSKYSAVTFISQLPKAVNEFRPTRASKPSKVLTRTESYADGRQLIDSESQVQETPPLLVKDSANFMANVAIASGDNIFERCNSCSNPLKHCCSQTILRTVLSKSSST
ncbi:hypothetical protein K2173_003604 [Erythroxylum novogranatense]|uniref:Uncharacterized protein n=1 Tax=Erythroxylum novogranatense TaxID=1862640 RepID=A0AAV8TAI3_9ROSI|nr:hypothetical protein K2173_003604 [Erythroxylum novogranatense]